MCADDARLTRKSLLQILDRRIGRAGISEYVLAAGSVTTSDATTMAALPRVANVVPPTESPLTARYATAGTSGNA